MSSDTATTTRRPRRRQAAASNTDAVKPAPRVATRQALPSERSVALQSTLEWVNNESPAAQFVPGGSLMLRTASLPGSLHLQAGLQTGGYHDMPPLSASQPGSCADFPSTDSGSEGSEAMVMLADVSQKRRGWKRKLERPREEELAGMTAREREDALKRAKNREAARKSRERKLQRLTSLTAEMAGLQAENRRLSAAVHDVRLKTLHAQREHALLKAQVEGLQRDMQRGTAAVVPLSPGSRAVEAAGLPELLVGASPEMMSLLESLAGGPPNTPAQPSASHAKLLGRVTFTSNRFSCRNLFPEAPMETAASCGTADEQSPSSAAAGSVAPAFAGKEGAEMGDSPLSQPNSVVSSDCGTTVFGLSSCHLNDHADGCLIDAPAMSVGW